jgi:hypothetical protein
MARAREAPADPPPAPADASPYHCHIAAASRPPHSGQLTTAASLQNSSTIAPQRSIAVTSLLYRRMAAAWPPHGRFTCAPRRTALPQHHSTSAASQQHLGRCTPPHHNLAAAPLRRRAASPPLRRSTTAQHHHRICPPLPHRNTVDCCRTNAASGNYCIDDRPCERRNTSRPSSRTGGCFAAPLQHGSCIATSTLLPSSRRSTTALPQHHCSAAQNRRRFAAAQQRRRRRFAASPLAPGLQRHAMQHSGALPQHHRAAAALPQHFGRSAAAASPPHQHMAAAPLHCCAASPPLRCRTAARLHTAAASLPHLPSTTLPLHHATVVAAQQQHHSTTGRPPQHCRSTICTHYSQTSHQLTRTQVWPGPACRAQRGRASRLAQLRLAPARPAISHCRPAASHLLQHCSSITAPPQHLCHTIYTHYSKTSQQLHRKKGQDI